MLFTNRFVRRIIIVYNQNDYDEKRSDEIF